MNDEKHGIRLIRNSVFALFNNVFMVSTTWFISIWVARQLGPANYGIFTFTLWATGTASWLIGMGFIHAITKFIAEAEGKNETTKTAIVLFVLKLELVVSFTVTVILVIFQTSIADFFFSPNESFFFFLAFLGLIPGTITAIFSATIEGIQKFEYFTWASLFITPFSFAAKILVLHFNPGISGLLIVMLVFSLINSLFYLFVLKREGFFITCGATGLSHSTKSRIMRYNTSVVAILLCDKIIWDKSENFFLGRFCNSHEIAYYNLGFNVVQRFMSLLPDTFWRVLFPAMSNYFGSGDEQKMKRLFFLTTRYLAFFSFPVGVAGAILAFPLLVYLYGRDYLGAQRVLQIIFLSSIFPSITNPASAILYGYEKQHFIYKYGAILAVLNIILDILFIKKYGAVGAAVCFSVTTMMGSIGGIIYTCRTMKLRYPLASLLKILFSTVIMGMVMQMIILRYPFLSGYIIAAVAGITVYLISALVLGTFEKEDYTLLESIKVILPGKSKMMVDSFARFLMELKYGKEE